MFPKEWYWDARRKLNKMNKPSTRVHNQVSQPGGVGRKGGPQNAELKVFLLRKMEEYNYTFRNTDDEDRRYKAFISYKALEKFLKDAKKANFIK